MLRQERRRQSRVEKEVLFKLSEQDISTPRDLITTQSINISLTGAYCRVTRFIPVFTKVQVLFELPSDREKSHEEETFLACEGTVVRTEVEMEESKKEYKIAIFFEEVSDTTLNVLNRIMLSS